MTAEPIGFPTHRLSAWRRYGERWRRIGKEIFAIVLLFFTAVIGFSVCVALVPAGIGLLPLFPVGIFLLADPRRNPGQHPVGHRDWTRPPLRDLPEQITLGPLRDAQAGT